MGPFRIYTVALGADATSLDVVAAVRGSGQYFAVQTRGKRDDAFSLVGVSHVCNDGCNNDRGNFARNPKSEIRNLAASRRGRRR